ncbi:2OG-Fe(II) oxygenase [Vicingus serpentipes]|uniref:2OG-Fe(II) oxygenase n=1 Tax=Vicingus serpentipes TaxID=1926625 RepID=A0A5C6RYJ9_9FLAO|nr:2OG-Fe(II) oxygenase [Vicingus serpentipes]TXB67137.1 2OG-Fe(II) oxygenase [Vicingus serpentipes]
MYNHPFVAETISAGIIEKGYAVVDNLLPESELQLIKERFEELQQEDEFLKAGIGKQIHFTIDNTVRGDFIRWIDTKDQSAPVYKLYEYVNELVQNLNRTCFLGIKDYETHYAYYPKGKGYKMHRDRFKTNPHRIVSFVFYLNENWHDGDGGELVLYNEEKQPIETLAPKENRLAVFLSETLHEVKECNSERRSITGWLLDIPTELTFLG